MTEIVNMHDPTSYHSLVGASDGRCWEFVALIVIKYVQIYVKKLSLAMTKIVKKDTPSHDNICKKDTVSQPWQ